MRRLAALLALILLALTPAAARSLPAMACCPAPMAAAMDGHGGEHRQRHDMAPADAADCALQVAADLRQPVAVVPAPISAALPPWPRPTPLAGLTHAAEPRPPRIA